MKYNRIILGDNIETLKTLPDNSVDCCITSPPYYGLRDYGIDGQIGLEETPTEYIEKLVNVFREVKRILRDDGTLWLNIGDSYAGSGKGGSPDSEKYKQATNRGSRTVGNPYGKEGKELERAVKANVTSKTFEGIKAKDLIGIPWTLAFALRTDGWYLRQDIIWHKPNPMPESVTDRCTKSHEYIFLLSKSKNYYFDGEAIKEPCTSTDMRLRDRETTKLNNTPGRTRMNGLVKNDYLFKNKRSVWSVNTKPFKEAHFATFPETLVVDCIKAGCPVNGIVLDPFMGSGTTAVVAVKNFRKYIGCEINPEYIKTAEERIRNEKGLWDEE